jgi:anti-sigma regulatory factor (Ser/Thr protein kinase)
MSQPQSESSAERTGRGEGVAERAAGSAGAGTGEVELHLTSTPGCLSVVRAAVHRMCLDAGFSDQDAGSITWAVDEALSNVIRHGYENQPDRPIRLQLAPVTGPDGRRGLRTVVRDQGRQVDPATIQGRDLEEVRPGGLGVHVIRKVMDEVEYSCPDGGGMMLRMVKYVATACDGQTPTSKA